MALIPKVKLKAVVSFPAAILDGAGIDVVNQNGSYQFNISFDDFAPPIVNIPPADAPNLNALLWNKITNAYTLTPITAFVASAPGTLPPLMNGVAAAGVSVYYSREDHVHPTDTTRAPVNNPVFTGTVTSTGDVVVYRSGTPAQGQIGFGNSGASFIFFDGTTFQLTGGPLNLNAGAPTLPAHAANKGYVDGLIAALPGTANPLMNGAVAVGVAVKFSREDHVHPTDTSLAPIASPTFTGDPKAPTAAPGDNDTSIANTAFVTAAVTAAGGTVPSNAIPALEGVGAAGASALYARGDHVHPAFPFSPTGRVSLVSGTPFMNTNQLNRGAVFFTGLQSLPGLAPDAIWLPSFDGTQTRFVNIGVEKSLTLDANAANTGYHQAGKVFDLFWDDVNGRLCSGPAWTSNTARAAALAIKNGFLTNAASMVSKFDATAATFALPANRGLLLGTFFCNAAASVSWQPRPAAVAGGAFCCIGISNVFNRTPVAAFNRDGAATWTLAQIAWRMANGGAGGNNKILFVDAIQRTPVVARYTCQPNLPAAGGSVPLGIYYAPQLDWVAGAPDLHSNVYINSINAGAAVNVTSNPPAIGSWLPVLGLHEVDAVEAGQQAGSITIYATGAWSANNGQMQGLSLDFEY